MATTNEKTTEKKFPTGTVNAELVEYDLGTADSGTDQIAVLFRVTEEPWVGRELTYYGPFTKASFPFTCEALRAMGWQGDDFMSLRGDLKRGNKVRLVLEVETWDGVERPRIKFVNAAGLRLKNRMAPARREVLARELQGWLNAGLGERNAVDGPTPGAGKDDDDIPF